MGILDPNAGSWNIGGVALPDFGITEAVAALLGKQNDTTTGGSQLFGNPYTNNFVSTNTGGTSPNVYAGRIATTTTPPPATTNNNYIAPPQQQLPASQGGGFDWGAWQQVGYNDQAAALSIYKSNGGLNPGQSSGGSGGGGVDLSAQVRNDINSGYNNYFSSLDSMLGGLDTQRTSQEGVVGNNYNQALTDIGSQKSQGMVDLNAQRTQAEGNQVKNLRDLSENLRNQYMAGNIYLGSQGAGDSSAANQYSYALTKLGNEQRGNVIGQTGTIMNDINGRETNLKTIYDTEASRIGTDRANKLAEVGQWFADSQNQIKQMKANGELSKSTDLANLSKTLLQNAINKVTAVETDAKNYQAALQTWAANNSTSIGALKSNMAAVSNYQASLPQAQFLNGTPTIDSRGNYSVPAGYGVGGTQQSTLKLDPLTGKVIQ